MCILKIKLKIWGIIQGQSILLHNKYAKYAEWENAKTRRHSL